GVTPFRGDIPLGDVSVEIKAPPGWTTFQRKFRLVRGEPTLVSALFSRGGVNITSDPSGLGYELSNTQGFTARGTTPAHEEKIPSGTVTLRVSPPPGWVEAVRKLEVAPESRQKIEVKFFTSTADVDSEPSGLKFVLRTSGGYEKAGVTPARIPDVPSGPATLTVSRPGWPDFKVEGSLEPSTSNKMTAVFKPGSLAVASEPSGAKVLLGDRVMGVTPMQVEGLIPGPTEITLKLKGYRPTILRPTVDANGTVKVDSKLARLDGVSRPERWSPPKRARATVQLSSSNNIPELAGRSHKVSRSVESWELNGADAPKAPFRLVRKITESNGEEFPKPGTEIELSRKTEGGPYEGGSWWAFQLFMLGDRMADI
ncbi:MAG: PEGA domain-containing protein, partial [Acidobacteriia bacterium]|nr:PEGA domain-containing protein [Terriglobia bacterium]